MHRNLVFIIACLAAAAAMFAVALWFEGGSAGGNCAGTVVQGPDHGGVIGSRDLSFLPTTDCSGQGN